jgi:predicted DNA-binding ribbon-helix-helix protein
MKSQVVKRSVVIGGRKTSISIEDLFWRSLKEIAKEQGQTLSQLVGMIKANRSENSNLSSAIRVFILSHLRDRASVRQGGDAPTARPDWNVAAHPHHAAAR